jgi:hypothetical protein
MDNFMFQLTADEAKRLRCQIGISNGGVADVFAPRVFEAIRHLCLKTQVSTWPEVSTTTR